MTVVMAVEVEVEIEVVEIKVGGGTRRNWISEIELYCC
jgi:hypothetical protein